MNALEHKQPKQQANLFWEADVRVCAFCWKPTTECKPVSIRGCFYVLCPTCGERAKLAEDK